MALRKIFIVFVSIAALAFGACDNGKKQDKLSVVVSIFPIYDIARNIGGEKVDFMYIIPPGANPHSFSPLPSAVKQIQNAEIYIGIARGFDDWVSRYMKSGTPTRYLFAPVHLHTEDSHCTHDHDFEDDNPHYWLSVGKARDIAQKISIILSDIDPDNSSYYISNASSYIIQLNELDKEIGRMFDDMKSRKLIQWHPAWNYFAEDYGLEIIGNITEGHGKEPSVKHFRELAQKAKAQNADIIIMGLNVESKAVDALAKEINGKIIRLDNTGNPEVKERATYIDLMRHNAKLISEALKQGE